MVFYNIMPDRTDYITICPPITSSARKLMPKRGSPVLCDYFIIRKEISKETFYDVPSSRYSRQLDITLKMHRGKG